MIDAPELLQILQQEEQRAESGAPNDARKLALDFYNGEPFGDEVEGRSQLITRDVAEVVDQQVIGILRTMVSGDDVVEFDGEGEGDDGTDYGMEATEAVRFQFLRRQSGYIVLHDALKAGLLEKTGIVKSWVDYPTRLVEREMTADELHLFEGQAEILEVGEITVDDGIVEMARVRVREPLPPVVREMAVPNEEFLIAPDARSLDGPEYKAHRTRETIGSVVAMGFALEDVEEAWGTEPTSRQLSNARDTTHSGDDQRTGLARRVWLLEEYLHIDLDGDGEMELVRVHRIGTRILAAVAVDEHPFSGWTPFPMQHRFIGQSSADKTMDIQVTRSHQLRQAMDNLYLSNAPRMAVDMSNQDDNTIDDLLTVRPGGLVRYKGQKPEPLMVPFVADNAFAAMEVMTGEREARTGVTRHNQGLNPDTLNKTASGMAMLQQAGDQVEEYLARNFAEMLVAPMFAKRYRLMRKFGQPFAMKIDGKRVQIDPRQWPEEIDMLINVGLGTGRKDQRIMYRSQLLGIQKEAYMAGSPLVDDEKIYNNVRGLVKDAALGNPSDYFIDPDSLRDPETGEMPERPNPAAQEAQARSMIEAERVQNERAKIEGDIALRREAAEFDLQARREKAALDAELARDRAAEEARLAQERADREWAMAVERMRREAALQDASLPQYRPGGDLAA